MEAPELDWRFRAAKPGEGKLSVFHKEFLALNSIPRETFEYRLGNGSTLDWVIDQYQVSTDKRSGIANGPARPNF